MSTATKNRDLASRLNAARVDLEAEESRRVQQRARIKREADESVDPTFAAAAGVLKTPVREIVKVEAAAIGDVITTHDGSQFVVVPDDRPDANGRTGLMQLSPSRYSPFPRYAHEPTPPPAAPVVEEAVEEVEEVEDGPPAPPMDDEATLALYQADLRRVTAEAEAARASGDPIAAMLEDQQHGLKKIVSSRAAAVADRELRENPPPPSDFLVRINTAMYRWSRAVLDTTDAEVRDSRVQQQFEEYGDVLFIPGAGQPSRGLAPSELAGATKFFEANGLPLPSVPWDAS